MPVPQDEHERTVAFAEIALGQIKALSQLASPRNFEIWYHYATGYNQALNQSINDLLAGKATLSEADLERIYETFIATNRFGERADAVGTRVLDEIKHVIATIDAAAAITRKPDPISMTPIANFAGTEGSRLRRASATQAQANIGANITMKTGFSDWNHSVGITK